MLTGANDVSRNGGNAVGKVRAFFAASEWVDREVLRPLSHIRPNWELSWDAEASCYKPEDDSYAGLLNALIDRLDTCSPPAHYHDNEDRLGERVRAWAGSRIQKLGRQWVGEDGSRLTPDTYLWLLEQGGFGKQGWGDLILAAAGRIQAAIDRGQSHYDEMEESHRYMLAGVLANILYHEGSYEE